jgi:hypothetical protein
MARPAALAAFGAGVFTIVSLVIQIAIIGEPADNDRGALVRIADNAAGLYASLGAQVISLVLLVGALFYLLRATMHRRPEVPRMVTPLLPLAPLLLAIGGLLTQIDLGDLGDRFASSGARTDARAEDLLDDRDVVSGIIASAGTLCLALSFVFVSLNAMRAGLLSRFMGIIGIFVGGLLVLPLVPGGQSFIQLFWVVALGVLFLGRWPGGRGPAWESGEAITWPSAADRREAAVAGSVPVDDPRDPVPADADADADADAEIEEEGDGTGTQHPVSKKRKRKRRR